MHLGGSQQAVAELRARCWGVGHQDLQCREVRRAAQPLEPQAVDREVTAMLEDCREGLEIEVWRLDQDDDTTFVVSVLIVVRFCLFLVVHCQAFGLGLEKKVFQWGLSFCTFPAQAKFEAHDATARDQGRHLDCPQGAPARLRMRQHRLQSCCQILCAYALAPGTDEETTHGLLLVYILWPWCQLWSIILNANAYAFNAISRIEHGLELSNVATA
mmetsp:Transcript_55685/g.120314  ORF Transcript_55685/g.120314 Transcript_55685/m.120314 type:complete len:215 (+) Transcript_55685:995-1639(+)